MAAASGSGSDREVASSASATGSTASPYKTEAERRFEEVQRKRVSQGSETRRASPVKRD